MTVHDVGRKTGDCRHGGHGISSRRRSGRISFGRDCHDSGPGLPRLGPTYFPAELVSEATKMRPLHRRARSLRIQSSGERSSGSRGRLGRKRSPAEAGHVGVASEGSRSRTPGWLQKTALATPQTGILSFANWNSGIEIGRDIDALAAREVAGKLIPIGGTRLPKFQATSGRRRNGSHGLTCQVEA